MADGLQKLRRHQGLLARLGKVSFTAPDRLARSSTECSTSACRRQADTRRPYGPFYRLTRKIADKAVYTPGSPWAIAIPWKCPLGRMGRQPTRTALADH